MLEQALDVRRQDGAQRVLWEVRFVDARMPSAFRFVIQARALQEALARGGLVFIRVGGHDLFGAVIVRVCSSAMMSSLLHVVLGAGVW